LDQFVSYEENEVLLIRILFPTKIPAQSKFLNFILALFAKSDQCYKKCVTNLPNIKHSSLQVRFGTYEVL